MDWKNKLHNIENKIKQQFYAKNQDTLLSYYKLEKEFDPDNNKWLKKDEFEKLLAKLGIFLTTQELRNVYEIYSNHEIIDTVFSDNFFQDIKYNFSEKRKQVIKNAFNFVTNGEDSISIDELKSSYITSNHPRVKTKEKTENEVFQEFIYSISQKSQNGQTINEQEFIEYYADVNAVLPIEKEDYFENLIVRTWGLTTSNEYVSPERMKQLENIFYEKVRQRTLTKENEGKTIGSTFKYYDIDREGEADLKTFINVLKYFGCVFNKFEILALFNKYDTKQKGKIIYEQISESFKILGRKVN